MTHPKFLEQSARAISGALPLSLAGFVREEFTLLIECPVLAVFPLNDLGR